MNDAYERVGGRLPMSSATAQLAISVSSEITATDQTGAAGPMLRAALMPASMALNVPATSAIRIRSGWITV